MQLISIISHSRLIGKPNSQSNIGKHKSPAQASVLHGANYCITGRVGGDHKGTNATKSDGRLPEIITSQFPESLAPQGIAGNYRKLQMVNSGTHNPEVGGSSPPSATRSSSRNGFRYDYFFVLVRSPIKNLKVFVRFPIFNSLIGEGKEVIGNGVRADLHYIFP